MYKIGDKVIYQGADKNAYKRVGVVKAIEDKNGQPQLTVELDNGEVFTAPIDDWSREFTNAKACNSTNSVVRNAMAANKRVARNAEYPEDFDDNIGPMISSVASELEKIEKRIGKAVQLWKVVDRTEYAKGEPEKALAKDQRIYDLVASALQGLRMAVSVSR